MYQLFVIRQAASETMAERVESSRRVVKQATKHDDVGSVLVRSSHVVTLTITGNMPHVCSSQQLSNCSRENLRCAFILGQEIVLRQYHCFV